MSTAVKIAGRCECGVLDSMAWGDEHLECRGLRGCTRCTRVKTLAEFPPGVRRVICTACRKARTAEIARAWYLANKKKCQKSAKRYQKRQQKENGPWYRQKKAARKKRYWTDPAFRARHRRDSRERYQRMTKAA